MIDHGADNWRDHLEQRGTKDESALAEDLLVQVGYSYRPELGLPRRNASISLPVTTYQVIIMDCYRPLPLASHLFYLPTETVYCTTAQLPSPPLSCHKGLLASRFNPNKPPQCETLAASPHSSWTCWTPFVPPGSRFSGRLAGLKPHTGRGSLLGVQTIKIKGCDRLESI